MKITSVKSRAFALVTASALIAALVGIAPAHAAASGPTCDGKTPVQTCSGTTSDGAPYVMEVPANFGGTVTIWSHGLGTNFPVPAGVIPIWPTGVPVDPRPFVAPSAFQTELATYILNKGVAVMGSGFSTQAWNLDEALKTNAELVGVFKTKFPTTSKVVAWGYSMGGGITQAFAEKYPELVDAAAVMNPVDGPNAELKMLGDTLWLFKTFFDPTIKGGNYKAGVPGDYEAIADIGKILTVLQALQAGVASGAWPATSSATGKALEAAGIPSRSAILLIGLLTGQSTQSNSFDGISGPDGALKLTFPLAISPALGVLENTATALAYGIFMLRDADAKYGGAVFDNTKTNYAALLSENDRAVYNAALSGTTAINGMLQGLSVYNPGAPRTVGTPAAMAKYAALYNITGKINVPTVMMVGEHDPVEPTGIVQRIADTNNAAIAAARAAARAAAKPSTSYTAPTNNLRVLWSTTPDTWTKFDATGTPVAQSNTPGTGHTNFTLPQYKLMIDTALNAAQTGKLPTGGAWMYSVAKAGGLKIDNQTSYPWLKYYGK